MPYLTPQDIRSRATKFVKEWSEETRERAEAQTFWNEFLAIFGISRRRVASFEEPARKLGGKRGSVDLFWKGTLIIEHKSKGEDLEKAYGQALDYFHGLKEEELPRYVLISDFAHFRLFDLESGDKHEFSIKELPGKIHLFGFISGYTRREYRDEDPINVNAAEKIGELHDALEKSGYVGRNLELFLVRLVYCLFADDTGIFPKDLFQFIVETRTNPNGTDTGSQIAEIFQILNREPSKRQVALDEERQQFPYVNGALFVDNIDIPAFDSVMRTILLECCAFDWSRVSPAIFGSMFQSVMNKVERRQLGAHYTSETNILKVVHGLFLDELLDEFERAKNDRTKLRQLHDRIGRMKFLDPACGCGNFLIITYRELRRLENMILKRRSELTGGRPQLETDVAHASRIDVDAMHGIELEEFPARIAEVALWLTDHQMNMELSALFGEAYVRLPLQKAPKIIHGNALREDWTSLLRPSDPLDWRDKREIYLLGNPPFVGKQARTDHQNEDMDLVCASVDNYGKLDYVAGWYVKAAAYTKKTEIKCAFVSTNSITQGEQVGVLWSYLLQQGLHINFAHRTFKWTNEARGRAAVYCVIVGFSHKSNVRKVLFDYEKPDATPTQKIVRQINPYLVDAENILITSRKQPLSPVPKMRFGSMPNDGGHLLLTDREKKEAIKGDKRIVKYIRPFIGADDFLKGEKRWCLWLVGADPSEFRDIPEIKKRIQGVRAHRNKSIRGATKALANAPQQFGEIRQPDKSYLLVPSTTSENREYIPMGFFESNAIANNLCLTVTGASLYEFGILTSAMHMAWVRRVCGRLEARYRYSVEIVYNNFPWPQETTGAQRMRVLNAAEEVLRVRATFKSSSLADLYDPDSMPKPLLDAHRKLDSAVDKCYRSNSFGSELERLEFLFGLYQKLSEPLIVATSKKRRRS